MGEAGGEIQVANVRDLVVVKVKDREVPAHGDITLKPVKSKLHIKDEANQRVLLMYTYNILYILVRKVEMGENSQVLL